MQLYNNNNNNNNYPAKNVPKMMKNHLKKPMEKYLSLEGARKEIQRKEKLILMMIPTTRNLNISLIIKYQNIFLPMTLQQECPILTN